MEQLAEAGAYRDDAMGALDEAVFDVYELDPHERLIVKDGLVRAKGEYKRGRIEADLPAALADLRSYSTAFISVINAWQVALERRTYGADIIGLRSDAPLRVIRFVERESCEVRCAQPEFEVGEVLAGIGARIRLPITERLAAVRELRVHADAELLIIKPAGRRYWTPGAGLNDADHVLGDGLRTDA